LPRRAGRHNRRRAPCHQLEVEHRGLLHRLHVAGTDDAEDAVALALQTRVLCVRVRVCARMHACA
jgi:hypothetical protein